VSRAVAVRIFISTGEVSGDLQGAMLVEALHSQAQCRGVELQIVALGGERMAAAGATLLDDTTHIGSVGLLESLPFVLPSWRIQRRAQRYLRQHPPELAVLIDYPGPNLAIGTALRRQLPGVPVVYYIAPQEWVWSPLPQNSRQIARLTDRLLAVFPAEAEHFRRYGASVSWVGHPLLDRMQQAPSRAQARARMGLSEDDIAIALLPASRRQELARLLPVLFAAARRIQAQQPRAHFWIPLSAAAHRGALERAIARYGLRATLWPGATLDAIAAADLVLAKSGTVNLEAALLAVPQVVAYRVHPVTAWIARQLLRFSVPFVSPPNLLAQEAIVPEFLQAAATPDRIARQALALLQEPQQRQAMLAGYQRVREAAGEAGVCDRAASEILGVVAPRPNQPAGTR